MLCLVGVLTQRSVRHLWSNPAELHSDGSDEETKFQMVNSFNRKKNMVEWFSSVIVDLHSCLSISLSVYFNVFVADLGFVPL